MRKRGAFISLLSVLLSTLASSPFAAARVGLPDVFGDGMVLQRDAKVPIWGTADAGEKITISFNGQQVDVVADASKKWRADLPPMKAGGPWPLTVKGSNVVTFPAVYVGEVWICMGQSNMRFPTSQSSTATESASESDDNVRLLRVGQHWGKAEGDRLGNFSAVAFYFGKSLKSALNVPIGLIEGSEGGTAAEQWVPPEVLSTLSLNGTGIFYGQRVKPIVPYAIKGCIWYQGEANTGRYQQYPAIMNALIARWRSDWGQGDFPFLFVQIARLGNTNAAPMAKPDSYWANLRNAQVSSLSQSNTGMVVSYDVSDGNLHPKDKKSVGDRLAALAMYRVYGQGVAAKVESPQFERIVRNGDQAILTFTHAEEGLAVKGSADGLVHDFFWVDPDGNAVPATGHVAGQTIAVDLKDVKGLPDLYYAWSDCPAGNVFNAAGLPVVPFRIQSTRLRPAMCNESTIVLSANQPLNTKAADAQSYAIDGRRVTAVEIQNNGEQVKLTIDPPLKTGDTVSVKSPGIAGWDGSTAAQGALELTAMPGRTTDGQLFDELLFGELHEKVDPATALQSDLVKPDALKPSTAAGWKLLQSVYGRFDLSRALDRHPSSIGCAHAYVFSDQDQSVQLWIGSQDRDRVYVNGKSVFVSEKSHPAFLDLEKIPDVPLKKGWNSLLLEVLSDAHGQWGCSIRLMDAHGKPTTSVSYQADAPPTLP